MVLRRTAVSIFKPHDVVFTQITTRLHFDNFQWNFSRVSEAVGLTQWNIGALVFRKDHDLVTIGNLSGTTYNNPMLRAVVVHLQRQRGSRFNCNALDLMTLTYIYTVIPAPWPCYAAVLHGLRCIQRLQFGHHFLNSFSMTRMGHEQSIRRINNQQILGTKSHYRAITCSVYVGSACTQVMGVPRIAACVIAGLILLGKVGHGIPATNVAPKAVERKHTHIGCTLHDCIVNRLTATTCKYLRIRSGKKAILLWLLHGFAAHLQNIGGMVLQCIQQGLRTGQKDTGIPQILATGKKLYSLV